MLDNGFGKTSTEYIKIIKPCKNRNKMVLSKLSCYFHFLKTSKTENRFLKIFFVDCKKRILFFDNKDFSVNYKTNFM